LVAVPSVSIRTNRHRLEDLDGDLALAHEGRPRAEKQQSEGTFHRKPLPDGLPRDDVQLDTNDMT
jgi:hypothetical protein